MTTARIARLYAALIAAGATAGAVTAAIGCYRDHTRGRRT